MPIKIDGETFYRTAETCELSEISRATLLRWRKAGLLTRVRRDRRGWRLFTKNDIATIKTEARRVDFDTYEKNYGARLSNNK